jgi:hypothetical protein
VLTEDTRQKIYQFLNLDPNEAVNIRLQAMDVDIWSDRVHLFDLDERSWPKELEKLFVTLEGGRPAIGEGEREGGRKRRRTAVKEEPADE